MKLTSIIVRADRLTPFNKKAMFTLFAEYYDSVSFENFTKDLSNKEYVILLEDESKLIRGFTTITVMKETSPEGNSYRAIFSGDTIIHHQFRGEQQLPVTWFKLAGSIKAAFPNDPLFWFLIVKGEKTYRYLPAFFNHYYPCYNNETPPSYKDMMTQLSRSRFGDLYDADSGLIRFPRSQGHLKSFETIIKDSVLKKPEIQFFLKKNPHFDRGDELVCLAELYLENLRSLANRAFQEGMSISIDTSPTVAAKESLISLASF
jgi:hypothetical protein